MDWGIYIIALLFGGAIIAFLFKIFSQVNERLNQMQQTIQEANKIIGQNLGNATVTFGNVMEQLGRLEETNREVLEISKEISALQDLLKVPKFRGGMGETFLENLLSQVLPAGYYTMQYRFQSSDTVDAVVKLGERLVPIDAKFSLENFQKTLESGDEQTKSVYRKRFIQDVKNRIDEVASKYILPQENTYDFALMYIPAENVYYETIIKEDLFSYSLNKRVIPVSPNTFYAYLQVICLGLKGLEIEENAKDILKNLSSLSLEIDRFREDFNILGAHLSNAGTKYHDAQRRIERIAQRIADIQETKKIEAK